MEYSTCSNTLGLRNRKGRFQCWSCLPASFSAWVPFSRDSKRHAIVNPRSAASTILPPNLLSSALGPRTVAMAYIRSRRGRWMPLYTPRGKKRTALLRKLKQVFQNYRSQPVKGLIEEINPILRGWVNYFAVGHSSRCFSYIRDWGEKKMPCHLARARQRQGFGWKRWNKEWLYGTLGLLHEYRVAYQPPSWALAPTR